MPAVRRTAFLLALATTPFVRPSAAQARGDRTVVDTVDGPEIAAILTDAGQAPELTTDTDGDPLIKATHEGAAYTVLFYGCANHRSCTAIQFRAWWNLTTPVPLDVINTWNRSSLLGRAYLDRDGDPTIEHTVRLKGGVTLGHLGEELKWFQAALREFEPALMATQAP